MKLIHRTFGLISAFYLSTGIAGAGIGSLPTPTSQDAGVSPRGIAVGDLTGKGSTQLAVANFGSPTFIGQTTPASQLGSSSIQVFNYSASGLGLIATFPTAASPRGLFAYDLDGQGADELLVSAYDAGLLQVFHWQQGSFTKVAEAPAPKMPVGVTAGVTGPNGQVFAVVCGYGADLVSIYPYQDGKLGTRTDIPVPGGPVQAAVGDLDGDHRNDIAVIELTGNKVQILSPKTKDPSSYALSRTLDLPEGGSPADLRLADLNGDGRVDLAVVDFVKNTLLIYLQQADGSLLAQAPLVTSGQHPNGMTVADLDGDGRPEIIVANRDSDSIDIFSSVDGHFQLTQTVKVAEGNNSSFGPVEIGVLKTRGARALVASHMRSNSLKVLTLSEAAPTPVPGGAHGEAREFTDATTYFYPNPAKGGSVNLRFDLPESAEVTLQVFDLTGAPVYSQTLSASQTAAGENNVAWNLTNSAGESLASGSYIARITTGGRTVTRKLAVIH